MSNRILRTRALLRVAIALFCAAVLPPLSVIAGGENEGAAGQSNPAAAVTATAIVRLYDSAAEAKRYDDLLEEYGRNKVLPEGFELQALIALSHYPQLKDIKVEFLQKDVQIPISSRPRPLSVFRSPMKRRYIVVIDTERDDPTDPLILSNEPFNAQIGILGHELAHTANYIQLGFFGVVEAALCQLSEECRREFERATDFRTVDHGLGWQRMDHSAFVREGFRRMGRLIPEGGETSGGTYMGPAELRKYMAETGMYDMSLL